MNSSTKLLLLTLCGLLLFGGTTPLPAQPATPSAAPQEPASPPARDRKPGIIRGAPIPPPPGRPGPEGERIRRNREMWRELPEEQKEAMRQRARELHRMVRQEAETALRDSGLQLDEAQTKAFFQRYTQLRRELEKELRRELEEKRREGIQRIQQEMREFFTRVPGASQSSSSDSSSSAEE